MLISLTVKEMEKLRDLLDNSVRVAQADLKGKDSSIRELCAEPIEESVKLSAYLDSKIPKDY